MSATEPPKIELVVNLWNEKTDENGFFVVGGTAITNANLNVPDQRIKFRTGFTKGLASISNFLLNGNVYLVSIGLLYKKSDTFKEITLDLKVPSLKINSELEKRLRNNLVDLVVYGRKVPFDRCSFFERIYPDFEGRKYVLREFDTLKDHSLNRCAVETTGFLPEKIKLGKPTPGAENDCDGPHFIIEHEIDDDSD